ncbi:uncharacterized protein Dana_GF27692, isoform A [Drosophila ananassae]|uniref:Uncharacterized protein, isoform A n=1 Tax=Drosophila ananassae TaxID=7217 RepID=A0A0P9C5C4_DROAN|nr:uncharacterized protein LOC26515101 isoform X2 [Drosophila ananassae]KPU78910.1 uncharacterized protein Dana_GF27692, isoform A [Drosophila ananassae]
MIMAKKCCFCLSLQMGCIIIFLVGVFASVMHIDYVYSLLNRDDWGNHKYSGKLLVNYVQMTPYIFTFVASFLIFFFVLSQNCCLFWATLVFQAIDAVFLLTFSVITTSLGINIVISRGVTHAIIYWLYVFIWLALIVYFMIINYSYYRQIKEKRTENAAV